MPTDRKEKGKHLPQRAGSMWTSVACGESQFFHLTSVLWAPTLHQSQYQEPFPCSSDTGQHFLQEIQTLYVTNCPYHYATCSKQTSRFIRCLVSSLINNKEANGFCHWRIITKKWFSHSHSSVPNSCRGRRGIHAWNTHWSSFHISVHHSCRIAMPVQSLVLFFWGGEV